MRPSRTTLASMTLAAGITVLGAGGGIALASSSAPVEVEHEPMVVRVEDTTVENVDVVDAPPVDIAYEIETDAPYDIMEDGCPPCGMG